MITAQTRVKKSREEYKACGTIYKDRFFLFKLQLIGNSGNKILIWDRGKHGVVVGMADIWLKKGKGIKRKIIKKKNQ